MKHLFYFVMLSIALWLVGCVKVLNDDLGTKETKLVLNATISPDSLFFVNLSRTFNIFEDESNQNLPFIDSAVINLYEEGNFIAKLKGTENGYYYNPGFYPEIGKEYKIEASSGNYKQIVSKTVIPAPVPIAKFDTAIVEVTDEYQGTEVRYIGVITYNDPANVANQYQLTCRFSAVDGSGTTYSDYAPIWPVEGDQHFFEPGSNGNLVWGDKYTDGNEVTVRFVFYSTYKYNEGKSRETQKFHFVFYLQSIDKDYFTYLKSVGIYWESGGSDNPFSEPVVIHSNVDNGYGIFGGYSEDTASTDLYIEYGSGKEVKK